MKSFRAVKANRFVELEQALLVGGEIKDDFFEPVEIDFEEGLLLDLLNAGLKRLGSESLSALDAYFAPRLHAALRLPRRWAAREDLWAWVASVPMKKFMTRRWPIKEEGSAWRYKSSQLWRHGVARLWWAAEILRDGPDYSLVQHAVSEVYSFQFISELKYSHHKECARAFARIHEDKRMSGDQSRELSKLLNVYLKSTALEHLDYADEQAECSSDKVWLQKVPSLAELTCEVGQIVGPRDGYSRKDIEEELYGWLLRLHDRISA